MWEQWRAEIDRSLRDAEAARDLWSDREFRVELRNEPERALERFRLVAERPAPSPRGGGRLGEWWGRAVGWALPRQASGTVVRRGGPSI